MEPLEPPLDPPLHTHSILINAISTLHVTAYLAISISASMW